MKEFNLEEYLKDPSRKVVTRDGKCVRITCTDMLGVYPVIGLVRTDKVETVLFYTDTGRIYPEMSSGYDLFFAPERKEGWVNVYKNEYGAYVLGKIFIGKEHEEVTTGLTYITTAKIEWEE